MAPYITSLMTAGCTTTSSTRPASPCLWELTPLSSSTTELWAPGSGGASAIICKQYQINHVPHWWQHRLLINLQIRYDRKDPTVVAVSLSPEGSLLLGFHKSVFSFYQNQLPLYKLILKACTAWTSPKCATTNVTLELDSPGWGVSTLSSTWSDLILILSPCKVSFNIKNKKLFSHQKESVEMPG